MTDTILESAAAPAVTAARLRDDLLPRTTPLGTLGFLGGVVLPALAKGVIIRRRLGVAAAATGRCWRR
jgi:hypothetical protein